MPRTNLAGLAIFIIFSGVTCFAQKYDCLPSDVTVDTVVSFQASPTSKGGQNAVPVTVKQTLKKLKARCSHGKLTAGTGKRVYFYHLQGCWGNPPADYLAILDEQKKEIEKLKRTYALIELTCEQDARPRY